MKYQTTRPRPNQKRTRHRSRPRPLTARDNLKFCDRFLAQRRKLEDRLLRFEPCDDCVKEASTGWQDTGNTTPIAAMNDWNQQVQQGTLFAQVISQYTLHAAALFQQAGNELARLMQQWTKMVISSFEEVKAVVERCPQSMFFGFRTPEWANNRRWCLQCLKPIENNQVFYIEKGYYLQLCGDCGVDILEKVDSYGESGFEWAIRAHKEIQRALLTHPKQPKVDVAGQGDSEDEARVHEWYQRRTANIDKELDHDPQGREFNKRWYQLLQESEQRQKAEE